MSEAITIDCPPNTGAIAAFLKAHLRLMQAGMKHSRLSGNKLLSMATTLTGKPYKRSQYGAAITDLQAIIDAELRFRHNATGDLA